MNEEIRLECCNYKEQITWSQSMSTYDSVDNYQNTISMHEIWKHAVMLELVHVERRIQTTINSDPVKKLVYVLVPWTQVVRQNPTKLYDGHIHK